MPETVANVEDKVAEILHKYPDHRRICRVDSSGFPRSASYADKDAFVLPQTLHAMIVRWYLEPAEDGGDRTTTLAMVDWLEENEDEIVAANPQAAEEDVRDTARRLKAYLAHWPNND